MSRNYHHGDLRNQLIEKGLILLSNEGVSSFSLRKVAKMCNVSHSAPYRHFENKDDLIQAIAREGFIKFHATLKKASEKYPTDYKLQLRELGQLYLKFAVENPDYMRILFTSVLSGPKSLPAVSEFSNHGFDLLRDCIRGCITLPGFRFKEEKPAILMAWSLVHGLSMLLIENNDQEDFIIAEVAKKMFESHHLFFDE